ncbi:MAG: GNAT family N-acetyltransferase [Chloroflexi bacterium]|nr:GNAT family N-acetyltransferase [Chloroflexota bacterium]MDA1145277.1 GNAT family N-acetyltransferase [Chloroflexota bacterium]
MAEPTIRNATVADLPSMLSVIEASFPHWPAFAIDVPPLDHLTWKLGLGGVADCAKHTVVELDGQVIGSRLRWFGRVRVGDREYTTENGADLSVHPDFQGRGISRLLAAYRDAQFAENGHLGFGTPSNSPQVLHINDAPETLRPLTIWRRHHRARGFARAQLAAGGIGQLARTLWRAAASRRRARSRPTEAMTITLLDRFDDRTDQLWHAARADFEVATVRTAEYLNWRYRDPRGGRTVVLASLEGDRCLGYLVLKADGDAATIPDLLAHPDHPDLAERLLAEGVRRIGEQGCTTTVSWLPPGHPYEQALRRAGFIEAGSAVYDLASPPDGGPPEPAAILRDPASRFHVTLGDFDFV